MPNLEQVKQLKHNVEQWNQWRYDNPHIQPDLSFANLREADLSGANLNGADLSHALLKKATLSEAILSEATLFSASLFGANLSRTTIQRAILQKANLSGADLSGANLSGADLSGANLYHANLSEVDLSYANLRMADFRMADLNSAIFNNIKMGGTIFTNVDFRSVRGLTTINHEGPSMVALHSIYLPQDGSALHFLRGVGVPDEWIDFYHTTMMHPIQYYSVFISYSSVDEHIATRLHADLQAHGVRCWFAPHDLKPGNYMRKEVDQAIHLQDKLLLILSESAINSDWVNYEVELALAREIRQKREILFPIRLDHEVLHNTSHWAQTLMDTRHIGDFTKWTDPQIYQQSFDRLLRDLKKIDGKQ